MIYYLGLGSNLGSRKGNIDGAIEELSAIGGVRKISSFYETEPWGYSDQGSFLNAAVEFESDMKPMDLLRSIKEMENKLGREASFHWGPRVIDIDILLCLDGGEEVLYDDKELTIPHRMVCKRNFNLICLRDLGLKRICGEEIEELIKANG